MSSQTSTSSTANEVALFEALVVALALITVGPFTLLAAAGLTAAAIHRHWRRLWLWLLAAPSAAAAFLLWPLVHRHLLAAAAALHAAHTHGHPERILAVIWPHLWPTWLCTLTIAPLLALVIVERRPRSQLDRHAAEQRRQARRTTRLERRLARRAESDRGSTGDPSAIFLGYTLGGDAVLPVRNGRAMLPLPRLANHLVVAGATGSGKTETVLRLAYSLAAESDWTIVYIDGKGDPQTKERFAALMTDAGRQVALFPEQHYNGWHGSSEEIANRLLQLIDFASEGGGTYYRDLAVNAVRLACSTPLGPPRSSTELLRRLSQKALAELHRGQPEEGAAESLRRDELDSIRARYAAFFATVRDLLDGDLLLEQIDSAYFLLDGLRLKYEAGYLARFLVEEFTQWAVARKPRQQRVLLIVDEFSAIAETSQGLVDLVERSRGFGVACALCPQVAEGMGGGEATARIIGSAQTILLHTTALPSSFADIAGTRRVYEFAHQLERDANTGLASIRLQHQYRVDLDEVRRLRVGQCFAISPGLAMKLQIVPAPDRTNPHR